MKLHRFPPKGRLLCGFAAAALLLCAADQWSSKDSTQWTSEDLQKILTDSPWSKSVKASMRSDMRRDADAEMPNSSSSGGSGPMDEGGGIGGMGRGGIGGMGRTQGGMGPGGMGPGGMGRGRPRESMPPVEVTVRWESALPVRQALQRIYSGEQTSQQDAARKSLDEPSKDYVITLIGLPANGAFDPGSVYAGPDSTDPGARPDRRREQTPEQIRQQLLSGSRLIRKDKDPIAPEDVKAVESPTGDRQIQIFFPKSPAVQLQDKEVTFQTRVGPMRIERKFRLKDMMYKGTLEL